MSNAYYEQLQFKPKINEISRIIGRKTQVADLADITQSRLHKQRLKEELEKKKMEDCSFKPKINRKKGYKKVKSHYGKMNIMDNIKKSQNLKEKRLE